MQLKHTSSPPTRKIKNVPSPKKVMLILFWDSSGPILEHYLEHGQTVNSGRYSAMLKDKLKPAACSKRRGLLSKTVLLHHDNVRPHAAAATIEITQKLNFELLPHPPYSPDLAPNGYHLFGSLKKALWGRWFGSDEEVKQAVHTWLCDQPKTFFSDGIKKLVECCKKCVDKQEDAIIMSVSPIYF
jgi:histone-lysine N-methyltransferase SETMAR